jgi:rSAM/selenodomain-associated transferase 1
LPQRGPDLGRRLENALSHYLNLGFARVVIMDSDSPTLPGEYLQQAFDALEKHDVVIGPCDDGGYYLIGLKRRTPRLLTEVRMSTPNVTADTLAIADKMGLKVAQLPTWYDVDDAESLERLCRELVLLTDSRATHTRAFLMDERIR